MIAVYDSGVGGLTALRALRRLLPRCDAVYLGDTARVPYGTRDAATVLRYAAEALDYLADLSPAAVLVACGTVSTVALPTLAPRYPFPVLGVAEAGVRRAVAAAPCGRVAVLGTEATVRSGYLEARLSALLPGAKIASVACPLFVALAECGMVDAADPLPRLVVERMLTPLLSLDPEAILLGCTHFPWLSPHIARLFPAATLVDCGAAAATELFPLLSGEEGEGRTEYLVTDGGEAFLRAARRMTGEEIGETVKKVNLT